MIVLTVGTLALGGLAISAGIEGYFYARMAAVMRVVAVAIGAALILAQAIWAIVPLLAFAAFWLWQMRAGRQSIREASDSTV